VALRSELVDARAEIEQLRAIVAKLPKCWRLVDGKRVQDVPVVVEMKVWVKYRNSKTPFPITVDAVERGGGIRSWRIGRWPVSECYDTQEAAEAARSID